MNKDFTIDYINKFWDQSVIPELMKFIAIPCVSLGFDKDWQKHGYIDQAMELVSTWIEQQEIPGLKLEIVRLPNRTPLLYVDVPGDSDETIVFYGHLDKMPPGEGWAENLDPWTPVLKNDGLHGRGGADDGYAVYAAISAIKTVQAQQQQKHARCVILIEASEESGSPDFPAYIEYLKDRLGEPALVICLDTGCLNYEQLWVTTSLRGIIGGILKVETMEKSVHSGVAGGVVPSAFRILQILLNRLQDELSGDIKIAELNPEIAPEFKQQANALAKVINDQFFDSYPFLAGVKAMADSIDKLLLNRAWKPALSVTGADGLPPSADAVSVQLAMNAIKISLRLPPSINDTGQVAIKLKKILEENPPYGAKVTFTPLEQAPGWYESLENTWLQQTLHQASLNYFGKQAAFMGEGGSIGFVDMLAQQFPNAKFVLTGILGPEANPHGPNEFLHLSAVKKVTCSIVDVLIDQYKSS